MGSVSATTDALAGETGNDDIKYGDDAINDGFDDCSDTIDNGHKAIANGTEDAFDLRGNIISMIGHVSRL
jgi:hypothetical protein